LAGRRVALRGWLSGTASCAVDRGAGLDRAVAPAGGARAGRTASAGQGCDPVVGPGSMTTLRQDERLTDATTLELLGSLLRDWHGRGWVSGTGGGICGPTQDGNLYLALTGVHKELVRPDDFFVVSPADGRVVRDPKTPGLQP